MKLICCLKIEHLHCNNQITNQPTAKQPIPTTAHSEHSAHTLLGINLHTAHNTALGSFCTQRILNKQPKSDKTDHEGWIYWSWSTLRCDLKPRSFKEAQVFPVHTYRGWTLQLYERTKSCFCTNVENGTAFWAQNDFFWKWEKGSQPSIEPITEHSILWLNKRYTT